MIECVTLSTLHHFHGNPIHAQHVLRHESIVDRQNWDVPAVRGMEYDTYDNPAAYYLVKRDTDGKALGCSRLYPTDRPYMLQEAFPHLVTKAAIPQSPHVWEGSRFCVDSNLPPAQRQRIVQEIVVGYLEFALAKDIHSIIGVMFPAYWRNIFIRSGWNVAWLGEIHRSAEGHKMIAGDLRITLAVLENVRKTVGLHQPILSYGTEPMALPRAA
jgi:acyl homoserine lactone synthase